jgi:GT2 family glycosyltransferase
MSAEPVLSFCIVTLQAREYLRSCLDSLYNHPPRIPYEVIVVDNHSHDGSIEMLRDCYPQVRLIENDRNRGFTAPMNQALRVSRGNYCIELNPDTVIHPGAFDILYDFMEAHPEAGICTPKVLNRDGTLQIQCRRSAARPWDTFAYFTGLAKLFPRSKTFGGYLLTYLDDDRIYEVEAVSGSCMIIRRAVLDQIGLLDEDYFAYQEDADFCLRARQGGWRIYYVPDAQVTHYGGEGGSKVEIYRAVYAWHRSYYLYYRKHLSGDYLFLFNWLYYGAMFVKLVLAMLATVFRSRKYAGTPKP